MHAYTDQLTISPAAGNSIKLRAVWITEQDCTLESVDLKYPTGQFDAWQWRSDGGFYFTVDMEPVNSVNLEPGFRLIAISLPCHDTLAMTVSIDEEKLSRYDVIADITQSPSNGWKDDDYSLTFK